jgi:hypothetical protein
MDEKVDVRVLWVDGRAFERTRGWVGVMLECGSVGGVAGESVNVWMNG